MQIEEHLGVSSFENVTFAPTCTVERMISFFRLYPPRCVTILTTHLNPRLHPFDGVLLVPQSL
jgi:hypothetical protein